MRELSRSQSSSDHFQRLGSFINLDIWRRWSLTFQFTIVAAIVIGIIMAVLGRWVSVRIETAVINNTAASAALYMDRFVEPYVQDLAQRDDLSPESVKALTELMNTRAFSEHVIQVKIWRPDGTIVFSNNQKIVGKQVPLSGSLQRALNGEIAPEFDHLSDEENFIERGLDIPLLEIYSPIREAKTARIIAVAEFYQLADQLANELYWTRMQTIMMVGGLSVLMLAALMGIVRQGSRTIATQQYALNCRISELSKSLKLNEELREHVADANRRATESNERFLQRVSAELHDGPVQLIGLALLRLDGISAFAGASKQSCADETLEIVRGALQDAMSEIRGLSQGLALPELENLSFLDALDLAITNHELRSGTAVDVNFPEALPVIPVSIKTCAYRFVQEGLNNAFRHAEGVGQAITVRWSNGRLEIEVMDKGPGISEPAQPACQGGIGLTGLRDRIESLGGEMAITSNATEGTKLQAAFRLNYNERGGRENVPGDSSVRC